ncbi:MAG: ABC transporter permease [Chloroflexota bacterium]|nr:ABC transporter permease [Chloroflexota bacterium]
MTARAKVQIQIPDGEAAAGRSPTLWARLARNHWAVVSLVFLVAVVVAAVVGPALYQALASADMQPLRAPDYQDYTISGPAESWPSATHWLGGDDLGRDTLARLLTGLRVSLAVALLVETINIVLGATLGLLAGTFGGWVDQVVSRLADMLFAFPGLLLAILISAIFGAAAQEVAGDMGRLLLVSTALALVSWPLMARFVRGQTLSLRQRDFVQAAEAIGARQSHIMLRHILPNVTGLIITAATLDMASVVLNEAVLSLLGLGIQPPGSSLGLMINQAQPHLEQNWFQLAVPGLTLTLLVLAFSFLGDGIRDALDPTTG